MNENVEMLQYIYQNAGMGKVTINQILEDIKDLEFKDVILEQLKDYEYVTQKCEKLLSDENKYPKDLKISTKIMTYFGIKMNSLKDDTSSHIAEMMINGSTMGITQITKNLNDYKNIDNEIKDLATRLLKIEQDNIEKLKPYL
ncbi:MAG: hypothetical protein RR290_00415 [Clostridia bacterium]